MHILLTDVLVCPRCGPAFGLILLANRIEDRRVLDGKLGCSNCREQYPIVNGTADLRQSGAPSGAGTVSAAQSDASASERNEPGVPSMEAIRIAALLGVTQGPAYVLLAGDAAVHANDVSAQLDDVEVIAVSREPAGAADVRGVSNVAAAALPLANGKMTGVAITGPGAATLLEEAARAVKPTGRLLMDPAPADAEDRLRTLGLRVLAREGDVLIAVRG